ncbi:laccase-6-like [Homalodisca vitripennis]|uniref:laccase-6-like n=1 Tax=Homalodisca vitripennis TaxID=197043 RepID=UPI001EEA0D53|nr:laccase-6-like [Homalodisca vitripennis]
MCFTKFLFLSCFIFTGSALLSVDTTKRQRQLTVDSDFSHPCVRECIYGANMVCYYTFIVDWYTSMSVQCGDCPFNTTACSNPGCIVGGGIVRPVISANRRTPGPAILVCENDTVIVDVTNAMDKELLTIHWHGVHQVGSPFMDGGPYVTQCPLTPGDSFRYQFLASPHGTHMWHGHVGYHDSSGLFGPLVVRRQEPDYISSLYDYDLLEHTITIWHWYNLTDASILPPVLDTYGGVYGYGLLVNGHAPFGRFRSKTNSSEVISTARAKFFVQQGKRYRFRLIVNSAIYCPVQVSIDNHTLLMISSDTNSFQPLEVDSLMVNAGERFSFVLKANQTPGCYWMRLRGLGDCGPKKSSTHGEVFVCYNGATTEPSDIPTYDEGRRSGKILNPVQVFKGEDYSNNELILLSNLTGMDPEKYGYNGTPDTTIYIQQHAQLYFEADAPGPWQQFNNITFEFTPFSMLTQREMLSASVVCDDVPDSRHCIGTFCVCPYTKKVPLYALVEIVLVDISVFREQDHPIHMHGYKFHVVAMGTIGDNVSLDYVRDLNERHLIPKKLINAPAKDTISVPNAGYTILRFRANNPGFWLFHCHVTNHMVLGMAMVLQVGEYHEMPDTPPNFPTCGNSLYDPIAQELRNPLHSDIGDIVVHSNIISMLATCITILFYL